MKNALRPANIEKYGPKYSEKGMWTKVKKVAKKAGAEVIYYVLVLYYALQSPSLSTSDKAKIMGALGYFILPLDLISDFIPLVGYSDDIAALLWAIKEVYVNITPDVKRQARARLSSWFPSLDASKLKIEV